MRAASFGVPPSRVPSICGEDIFDSVEFSKGVFSPGVAGEGDMAHDIGLNMYRDKEFAVDQACQGASMR